MKKMELLSGLIWKVMADVFAVTLSANALESIAGYAKFAWWHIPGLVLCVGFSRAMLSDVQRRYLHIAAIIFWKKTVKTSTSAIRAVRSLPALFVENFNRFQTEP